MAVVLPVNRRGRTHCLLAVALLYTLLAPHAAAGGHERGARAHHKQHEQKAAGGAPSTHGIAWVVQVSDLHISRHVHRDIAPDLEVFGAAVLAGIAPSALLLTGDLVDAKTPNLEGSQQYEDEWEAYSRSWRHMAAAAGLGPEAVLDLRGNHDVFDAARAAAGDPFLVHSATVAAAGARGAATRARVTELPPRLLLQANGGGGADPPAAAAACPAAVLVGVDAAPDVRMYAYTNFFGRLNASGLGEAAAALAAATSADRRCGGGGGSGAEAAAAPPLLSYSHYPLGTISSAPRPGARAGGGRELARMLAGAGAAAHVSGHLHALAGRFMFRRHAAPRSGGAACGGLPEFEVGDWKERRRWRLIAFDGPGVTIADFDFRDRHVRSLEPSAVVGSHIVVVTHASVSGGAAEAAAAAADDGGALPNARALVLPRAPGAPAVAAAQLRWACGGSPLEPGAVSGVVDLEEGSGHGAVAEVRGARRPRPPAGNVSDAARLYLGVLGGHVAVGCGSRLWAQAVVTDVAGEVSASPWRQVAQEPAAAAGAHAAGADGAAALASPGWRAAFVLNSLDWPRRARAIAILGWAAHLVLLLLVPRFCAGALLSAHARLAYPLLGRSPSLLRLASGALGGAGAGGRKPGGAAAARRALGACAAWAGALAGRAWRLLLLLALWPLRVMADCWARCSDDAAFLAMAGYGLLLLTGPWHLSRLSGDEAGIGAVFPWGLLLRPAGRAPLLYRCADPSLGASVLTVMCFCPLTLWLAHVSNTYAAADPKRAGALTRLAHGLALAPMAALWARWMLRVLSTYGPVAALLGPATGWAPALAYGWLRLSWRQPAAGGGGGGGRGPRCSNG
ncbi:MAG: hypothetical protein J3K34DRAFT_459429 [Monoraphidium minutum]|nr:MAG: hypothetical protein J3K34DRAFT_459429 [Monoraphidium minutum]